MRTLRIVIVFIFVITVLSYVSVVQAQAEAPDFCSTGKTISSIWYGAGNGSWQGFDVAKIYLANDAAIALTSKPVMGLSSILSGRPVSVGFRCVGGILVLQSIQELPFRGNPNANRIWWYWSSIQPPTSDPKSA